MTRTIRFLEKDFEVKLLEQAIAKSTEVYIEPGKEISEHRFPAEAIAYWTEKFKRPVLTIHEGKYVVINMDDELLEHNTQLVEQKGVSKRIVAKGFKATFVTKYNFNQAKFVEAPPPPAFEPIRTAPPPRFQNNRPNNWQPNNGFHKHQGGGYKGNRFGKS